MRFYYALTFLLPEDKPQTIDSLQTQLSALSLTLEPAHGSVTEFTAHFCRQGDNVTVELEQSRQAVEALLEGVQLIGMELLETPTH